MYLNRLKHWAWGGSFMVANLKIYTTWLPHRCSDSIYIPPCQLGWGVEYTIRLFSVISRTLVGGGSYPSAEKQSVYSKWFQPIGKIRGFLTFPRVLIQNSFISVSWCADMLCIASLCVWFESLIDEQVIYSNTGTYV